MSTARSSAQKPLDVHHAHDEQSTSKTPLLSTLTEVVQLLFHTVRNPQFSTDSPFALDTLRRAVKLTQPYLSRLHQELADHGIELSGHNRANNSVFNATTSPAYLGILIRELARTRDDRKNGSVRVTVLGEIYRRLEEEVRGARREVKRLEHLLEGRHTRKRHRRHGGELGGEEVGKGVVGESGGSGSGGLVEAHSDQDERSTSTALDEATSVDAAVVRAQVDSSRSLTMSPSRPSRLSQQRASDTSTPHLHPVDNTTRQNVSKKSTCPAASRTSSRRSQHTKGSTVSTSSDGKNSSSETSVQDANDEVGQSTDKRTDESTREAQHSPDRPAPRISKQSSSLKSGSRASRHGKAHSTSSSGDSQTSVHSGSAVATLGTGSKNKDAEHEDRGRKGCNSGLAVSVQVTKSIVMEKDRERRTAPGDFLAFGDRLDGGWSFDGLQDGTGGL